MSPTQQARREASAPEKVLVAVDGSVASLKAARLAVSLAASWHATVRFISVTDADPGRNPIPTARVEEQAAELRNALDYVCRLGTEAGVAVEGMLRSGHGAQPYERILDEAEDWGADLLLVGRRRHHGLGRALLGSQAEHVLEFAQLPVMVVPEPAETLVQDRAAVLSNPR